MATKIYKLNQKKNSAIFNLTANDGKMVVTYTFKDGNQFMPNMPARCMLRNEFYQDLLESSDLCQLQRDRQQLAVFLGLLFLLMS